MIAQAQDLDPEAWRRLCEIYAPLVYSWARKAGLQEADAADIVQEVFRNVAGHIARFRGSGPQDTFRGWLLTITRNEIRGWFRQQGRQVDQAAGGTTALGRLHEVPDWLASDSELVAPDADEATERDLLRRAAEVVRQDFEPQTWQAFWRCVVDERPPTEVAAELHMTANAVRQAKFRVLARLRETLGAV